MKKPSTDPQDIARALTELVERITAGQEYPDASWSVSQGMQVDYESLQRAYDDRCTGAGCEQEQRHPAALPAGIASSVYRLRG